MGPINCSKRALPDCTDVVGDAAAEDGEPTPGANETCLTVFFGVSLGAFPRGGVGGAGATLAAAFGRPFGRAVRVVTVLPHKACIILFHFRVLM